MALIRRLFSCYVPLPNLDGIYSIIDAFPYRFKPLHWLWATGGSFPNTCRYKYNDMIEFKECSLTSRYQICIPWPTPKPFD